MADIWGTVTLAVESSQSADVNWGGGEGRIAVHGTFGGGTVTVQVKPEGASGYQTLKDQVAGSNITGTADFLQVLTLAAGDKVRISIGAATNPSLTLSCKPVNTKLSTPT